MDQRVMRVGDLVDDYCPRERRVTDHVIVAMVDERVRQTRCTACESEHEYKEARMPRKKVKTDDAPALAGGVLVPKSSTSNGHADDLVIAPAGTAAAPPVGQPSAPVAAPAANTNEPAAAASANRDATEERNDADRDAPGAWFGHRPLIRATLPRTENDAPAPRAIPEFTMHQRHGRGGFGGGRPFRHQGFGGSNNGNGSGREPDGNRAPGPGGPGGGGGKGRHRRRHRRPR